MAREKLGRGLGKLEELLWKMLAQRIEVWWSEEGDRWGGRRNELSSAQFEQEEEGENKERERERVNVREREMCEREIPVFNDCGPSGSTGLTGDSYRSNRSGPS